MRTSFKNRIYSSLLEIPQGRVTTYKEIAQKLEQKLTGRWAMPFLIKTRPGYPVTGLVKFTGEVGGYSLPGGKTKKTKLLKKEEIKIIQKKVWILTGLFTGLINDKFH